VPQTTWRTALRTPTGAMATVSLLVLLALAVVGPTIAGPAAATFDIASVRQGSSSRHWFGTDALGRDILARVVVATRLSVGLALLATLTGVVGGVVLGLLPAVLPRWAGRAVKGAVDVAVAFPGLLVALSLAVVFGVGAKGAVLAIGLAGVPQFARLTESLAAGVSSADYVSAARLAGVSRRRLMLRHVLPNIGEPLVINATIGAGGALLAFAGLSFLGLGVQPPRYDWGRLLNEGLNRIYDAPVTALAPGLAVVIAGISFSLFGETVAQVVGLRTSSRRSAGRPAGSGLTPLVADGEDRSGDRVVLDVEDLHVAFPGPSGWSRPVEGVSLVVREREIVGVVGESASGKSLMALAVAGLLPPQAELAARKVHFLGHDVRSMPDRMRRSLLGTSLAMVFQDPMSSLNPALRVGRQLAEVAEVHLGASRTKANSDAVARLGEVRIAAPGRRARQYPHEFSGGMRQRVMVAMGLVAEPRLLIADEPTTALDVTVQRQVLALLRKIRDEHGAAILLISHDIAVVAELCERVVVMYGGTVVEEGSVGDVLARPSHPYTRALLDSVPDMATSRQQPLMTISGRPPDPSAKPPGCPFAPRCPRSEARCVAERPVLLPMPATRAACWFPLPDSRLAEWPTGAESSA